MRYIKYISERIKKVQGMRRDYIAADLSRWQSLAVTVDLALAIVVYGCGITDYFQYQFYKRSAAERKTFMVHRQRMWLVRRFNDRRDRKIFDHKPSFNRTFNNFLGRRWLDTATCSDEEFIAFTRSVKHFLVKPAQGSHGIGIRVVDAGKQGNLGLFRKLQRERALVEEIIEQHGQLAEFNPSSVNTLRVVTLLGADGRVNIITANLRLGNGTDRFADNFHHNGIAALLDVNSGLVSSAGVDKGLNYYDCHPLSGKVIRGFKVPAWDKVIDTVSRAALVIPTVKYVGWDLAIGKDEAVILVEGNAAADPDISQMPDQVGKWPLYEAALADR